MQAAEREGKALQGMSKEEYLKMMLPDSPPEEEERRKVRQPHMVHKHGSRYRLTQPPEGMT